MLDFLFFNSVDSLFFVSFTNLGLSSIPIPALPSTAQALRVEPIPTNGSKTKLFFFVKNLINLGTSVKENGAGCSFSILVSGCFAPSPLCVQTEIVSGNHSFGVKSFSIFLGNFLVGGFQSK